MPYKVELRYIHGWDDAGWTEEVNGQMVECRFETAQGAQVALNELFEDVKMAVVAGDMETEEDPNDYRIVAVGYNDSE